MTEPKSTALSAEEMRQRHERTVEDVLNSGPLLETGPLSDEQKTMVAAHMERRAASEAQEALIGAARKLAIMPELNDKLMIFVDHWGMDAYEPDEETRAAVRNIVHGMVASANALS